MTMDDFTTNDAFLESIRADVPAPPLQPRPEIRGRI